MKSMISKNKAVLNDFTVYCAKNPDLRFWQALRNWSNHAFVYVSDSLNDHDITDTFFWEGKDK